MIDLKIKFSFLPKKPQLLIIFLFTFHMYVFSQDNLSKLFESTLPSVLKIETFDSNGNPLMSGTGFSLVLMVKLLAICTFSLVQVNHKLPHHPEKHIKLEVCGTKMILLIW